MSDDPLRQIESLYHAARARPAEDRAAFLAGACAGDDALRREVESLLAADEGAASLLKTAGAWPRASLTGRRLGAYEIVGLIGAGGMGEVYRAHDTRLGRDVAVKILPSDVAGDPDRLSRFAHEARAAAALNHPNILAVYDVGRLRIDDASGSQGHEGDVAYLVTELLEGQTLGALLGRETLAISRVVDLAAQIADGLAAAHARGIVHRDIKPDNLFVTTDGRVKILDFGLAQVIEVDPRVMADAPTRAVTAPHTVLGTLGYMAPEQVRGEPVDSRADIFAFGCVLYEMLSGRHAFTGTTSLDMMSAILKDAPAPIETTTTRAIPPTLVRIVDRCLEKTPAARFQSTTDLAFALRALTTSSTASATERDAALIARGRPSRWRNVLIAALSLLVVALAWTAWRLGRPGSTPLVVRYVQAPPEDLSIGQGSIGPAGSIAVSPDGSRIAFIAFAGRTTSLWIRRLEDTTATRIADADDVTYPFWSADSQFLAFCTGAKLVKVPRDGGVPQPIADCGDHRSAGVWARDNTILFVPAYDGPVVRVSASGTTPPQALSVHAPAGWIRHLVLLPDGERFLFVLRTSTNGEGDRVLMGSTRSPDTQEIIKGRSNGLALARGSLFFTRNGTLFSAPFDAGSGTLGHETQIADGVAAFSASEGGTLAYFATPRGNDLGQRIAWFDGHGTLLQTTGDPGTIVDPRISPDGLQIAVGRRDDSGVADIWTYDIARNLGTRVTFNGGLQPVWSPDGRSLLYAAYSGGTHRVSLSGDGADGPMPGMPPSGPRPNDWSHDKRNIAFSAARDLKIAPANSGAVVSIAHTPFDAKDGRFSPDSQWIAYSSNESGRYQIYVKRVSGSGPRITVSRDGGEFPVWGPDGKEIYYRGRGSMLTSVPISVSGGTFNLGTPRELFKMMGLAWNFLFDIHPDGQRFVMIVDGERDASPITVVVNWTPPKG